jgi:hypothetical protein
MYDERLFIRWKNKVHGNKKKRMRQRADVPNNNMRLLMGWEREMIFFYPPPPATSRIIVILRMIIRISLV